MIWTTTFTILSQLSGNFFLEIGWILEILPSIMYLRKRASCVFYAISEKFLKVDTWFINTLGFDFVLDLYTHIYFTYIWSENKIAPTSIMYFELLTYLNDTIQDKCFCRLIVLLLYEVYEVMKPSECPFFHNRLIVLYKHATCSPQFFVKTYQKSLRHSNFISLCDVCTDK